MIVPITHNKAAALRAGVQLQPHQADIAATGDEDTRLLLYHALGSGKTLSALAAAEQSGDPYTAVMPASLRNNYRGEIAKWTDRQTPAQVMSYTALAKGLPYQQDSTLVYDEAHSLRNPTAARTINAISLAEKAKRLYLLSGSPIVNHPHDLVPAIQMLTGRKYTPEEFDKQFVGQQTVNPGFFARWRGVKPAKQPVLKNENQLRDLLTGHVDYHAPDAPDVERRDERITVSMSPSQSRLHKAFWNKLPWILRWKLQQEFPLSRKELTKLQSFLAGPRQVGLSTLPFQTEGNALQAFDQSPKLQAAFQHLQDSGNVPSVVASNFVTAGLKPYAAALERAGISHGTLHGGLTDQVRKKLVEDYNSGKLRTLLLGPAGTEGISLKGTRLLQILDPHWNETRGKQTAGRGIRFDSHVDLPPADRNVRIQRFISQLPVSNGIASWFGGKQSPAAADTYLEQMAAKKERLNQQFLEVLRQVGQKQGSYTMGIVKQALDVAAGGTPSRFVANTIGQIGGLPNWIQTTEAGSDPVADQAKYEQLAREFEAARPQQLSDTKLRLGGTDVVDDYLWKQESADKPLPWHARIGGRLMQNPRTGPITKLIGLLSSPVATALPNLLRASNYNQATDVATVYGNEPALAQQQLGRAIDLNESPPSADWLTSMGNKTRRGLYSALNAVPGGNLWLEGQANDKSHKALQEIYAKDPDKLTENEARREEVLPAGLGGTLGATVGGIPGAVAGLVGGKIYGRDQAHKRRSDREKKQDDKPSHAKSAAFPETFMHIPETLEAAATQLATVKQAADAAAGMDPGLQTALTGAGIGAGGAGLMWLMNRKRRKVNPLAPLLTGAALGGLGGGMYHYLPQLLAYAQKGVAPTDPGAAQAYNTQQADMKHHASQQKGRGIGPMVEQLVNEAQRPAGTGGSRVPAIVYDNMVQGSDPVDTALNTAQLGHRGAVAAGTELGASYYRNKARLASGGARNELDARLRPATTPGSPGAATPTPPAISPAVMQAEVLRNQITGGGLRGFSTHTKSLLDPSQASKQLSGISAAGAKDAHIPRLARGTLGATAARHGLTQGAVSLGYGLTDLLARSAMPLVPHVPSVSRKLEIPAPKSTDLGPTNWHPELRQPQAPQAGTP